MTLFIAFILLYQFDYGFGWYFVTLVLWILHLRFHKIWIEFMQ